MSSSTWSRHSDAIEDLREQDDPSVLYTALVWAFEREGSEAEELTEALMHLFQSGGYHASAVNRGIEIVLDGYFEDAPQEVV